MLANTISTFNSMTVHCARCHDHKFDPIPQNDYYRLQAVFAGVDRGDRPYADPDHAAHLADLNAQRERLTRSLDDLQRRIDALGSPELDRLDATLQRLRQESGRAAPSSRPRPRARRMATTVPSRPMPR